MNRWFDHLAERAARFASRGVFFAGCLLLIILWAASYFVIHGFDTWQLIINTVTTVVTFLLVALLQNSARRSDRAIHQKLDALADGLADLMDFQLNGDAVDLERDIVDLKRAVGLEQLHPRGGAQRKATGRLATYSANSRSKSGHQAGSPPPQGGRGGWFRTPPPPPESDSSESSDDARSMRRSRQANVQTRAAVSASAADARANDSASASITPAPLAERPAA